MDTLFYDGSCPLCRREIRLLRRLQRGDLAFADIHAQTPHSDRRPGREALLRRLHLRLGDGRWLIGLEANVHAWSHTRYGVMFRPLLWPGIRSLAEGIYQRWADRRYQRKYACHPCRASVTEE
ncbi:MAG: DUF393 domain-containing protein [Marinobacter sp.]|nr:DUF393 domain-containing protein [Marinobacter sp.]